MPEKKTKIFFLITKANWGGAQRYIFDLAQALKNENYDITVFLGKGQSLKEKLSEIGIENKQISYLKRDINFFKDILVFLNLIKIFKKERPDIIHLNSSKIGVMGALAGRLSSVPKIIFTGHGWAFNEKRDILSKSIIIFLHWLTIILSHKTIAVSEKIKEEIIRLPFVSKKITIIHNGVPVFELISKEKSQAFLLDSKMISENTLWFGTIAELHSNKSLDTAIRALALYKEINPNFIYLIIGEGEKRQELESLIKKLNLENNIYLTGQIIDARKYLKAFDLFILPSRTEALGMVILEAGIAKLPVIASLVGGIPEIIEDSKNGLLFPTGDFKLLADKLNQLTENEELKEKYGHKLYETVVQKFSINQMIEKTKEVYNY